MEVLISAYVAVPTPTKRVYPIVTGRAYFIGVAELVGPHSVEFDVVIELFGIRDQFFDQGTAQLSIARHRPITSSGN